MQEGERGGVLWGGSALELSGRVLMIYLWHQRGLACTELSSRRFRAVEAGNCLQNRCLLDCTLLQHRVGECGKACLQSVRQDTVLHSLALLEERQHCWGWQ